MDKFIEKLARVKKVRNGYMARCPAHADKTASLNIDEKEGNILIHCFAGCSANEIVTSLGLTMADLFNEGKTENKMSVGVKEAHVKKYKSIEEIKSKFATTEKIYEYNNLNEETSLVQLRYITSEGKKFATYHKTEDGSWIAGKSIGLSPLFNLNKINKSNSVIIVEGEKCVEILNKYNIPATTSIGGALGAENTDWQPLMNKPSVVIWRDNDEAGLKYENSVCSILNRLGVNARRVNVDKLGLSKGDDIEQFIAKQTGTPDEIKAKILACIPKYEKIEPVHYLKNHLEKVKKGEIKNWDVPFFPMLTKYARAFKPGTQTVIVSAGGVGKSLFIGRMADELVLNNNAKVKRLHLESSMSFYLLRSLAQQSSLIEVMEEEFHYNNPKESDRIVEENSEILNLIGNTITTSDSGTKRKLTEWSAELVKKWMTANADADILIIDPVSMVLDGDTPWKTSSMLTKHAEELMSEHTQLCVVWIQHTAESSSGGNVGGISGGKAWNRFSSSILEMIFTEDPDEYEVLLSDGITTEIREVQTYIKVKKARNGPAANWKIAMTLDKKDLTYKEQGRMIKKVKK